MDLLTLVSGLLATSLAVMTQAAARRAARRAGERRVEDIESTSKALREAYEIPLTRGLMIETLDAEALRPAIEDAVDAVGAPRPKNPAEFVTFWESTYKRLEEYHGDAGRQLRWSYLLAQFAAVGGFTLVGLMGWAAANADSGSQAASAAAVGVVGAALAAFISRTFSATYSKTLARSTAFFHEPVVMARLLAAERLLDEYGPGGEQERFKAVTAMISAAVAFDVGTEGMSKQTHGGALSEPPT